MALRVRMPEDVVGFDLTITLEPPSKSWSMAATHHVEDRDSVPYDGKRGLLAAGQFSLELVELGLYEVIVTIDGDRARVLKFDVVQA